MQVRSPALLPPPTLGFSALIAGIRSAVNSW